MALGLAVSIKLLPLISLPLLLRRLGFAQTVQYGSIAIGIFLLTFTPLLDNHLWQILLSVGLYFHTFSFNASIFYVVRWVLNTLSGTDATALAGYSMGFVTLLCILYYVFQEKYTSLSNKTNLGSFMLGLLFVWSSYLSLATTVHPWYVVPLVAWSVFTPYRFPLLWSLLVVGSYATYNNQTYSQNGYLIFAEYALVWIYAIWEYKKNRAIPANKMPYTNKV